MQIFIHKFLPGGAAILIVTSFASYALGLLRDRIFAQTYGAGGELDAYNASFIIPDLLLNIFVAGALAAGFIPVFSGLLAGKKSKEAAELARSIISSSLALMFASGIFIFIFAPYLAPFVAPGFSETNRALLVNLMRIMALSPIIFAVSNSLGSMLVSYKRFLFYGLSPALYNAGIIAGTFLLAPYIGIYGAAIGTVAGALLHLVVRVAGMTKTGFSYKTTIKISVNFKTVVRLMIPKMFGHPVELVTFWGFTAIASGLGTGSIASLNFARNFQSVPVSLFGIAFATSIFPVLSELAARKQLPEFRAQFWKTLRAILALTVFSAIVIFFARTFLIKLILSGGAFGEHAILQTAATLGVFTLAIPTESVNQLLARSFYALKNTVIPVAASIASLGIAVSLAYLLSPSLGILALPLGFFAGSALKTLSLFAILNLRVKLVG